jgi:tRNA G37 N-methylase TrmD
LGSESFDQDLLEYPQYTRPANYRGWTVPEVLLSGHHGEIAKWRQAERELRTRLRRPDLWDRHIAAHPATESLEKPRKRTSQKSLAADRTSAASTVEETREENASINSGN